MPISLISQDEMDALPVDNDEVAFAQFERITRDEMNRIVGGYGQDDDVSDVRFEYMTQVRAAAYAYGVDEMLNLPDPSYASQDFQAFYAAAVGITMRLGLKGRRDASATSVELTSATKSRLHRQADVLSKALEAADMPENRRNKLRAKLKEFTDELEKERSSIARMMAAMSVVAAALVPISGLIGTVEEDLIKVPQVIEAVQKITLQIGHAKGEELDRIPPVNNSVPPKPRQIEHKSSPTNKELRGPKENFDLDDEIPF